MPKVQNILSMRLRSFYGKIATLALFKVVFGAKKCAYICFWKNAESRLFQSPQAANSKCFLCKVLIFQNLFSHIRKTFEERRKNISFINARNLCIGIEKEKTRL